MTRSRGMTYFRAGQPESCSRRRRRQCALHSAVVVASLSSVHASAYASCNTRVLQPTTGTTMWQQPQQRAQPCGNSHHNRNHHVAAATTAGTTMWQHPQPQAQPCGSSHDSRHVAQGQILRNLYSDGTKKPIGLPTRDLDLSVGASSSSGVVVPTVAAVVVPGPHVLYLY